LISPSILLSRPDFFPKLEIWFRVQGFHPKLKRNSSANFWGLYIAMELRRRTTQSAANLISSPPRFHGVGRGSRGKSGKLDSSHLIQHKLDLACFTGSITRIGRAHYTMPAHDCTLEQFATAIYICSTPYSQSKRK
jgi:hypothetical protein